MTEAREPQPSDASPEPARGGAAPERAAGPEGATARGADHAAIDRLATELLPALVAKLTATGLGEIEVRQGAWKVRLRRPVGSSAGSHPGRRASDRPSRAQPGHEGHGHAPGALEGHRAARGPAASHSTNGSGPEFARPVAAGRDHVERRAAAPPGGDPHRATATSPAVGVFQLRPEARPGSRVRAGDRLGAVDMLGVPHDVVSPADGIVARILVDPGDAVEYGQELVALELMTQAPPAAAEGAV